MIGEPRAKGLVTWRHFIEARNDQYILNDEGLNRLILSGLRSVYVGR